MGELSAFNRRTKELEKRLHEEEVAELKLELARINLLLEDREALATVIASAYGVRAPDGVRIGMTLETALCLADRIREYLTAGVRH